VLSLRVGCASLHVLPGPRQHMLERPHGIQQQLGKKDILSLLQFLIVKLHIPIQTHGVSVKRLLIHVYAHSAHTSCNILTCMHVAAGGSTFTPLSPKRSCMLCYRNRATIHFAASVIQNCLAHLAICVKLQGGSPGRPRNQHLVFSTAACALVSNCLQMLLQPHPD